ncbi:hypothetical protein IG612_01250 [Pectobacterium sp. FL60-S17]|uniref:hypothetical protein n=1 Tax=Pectobacterium TaxID=122277 RepID=UPI0015DF5871|nr:MULTISPECIES: hypothetical protein [Pectobacterium]MBA0170049.1 hypothetical protein [Pectobacterium versatile]MBE5201265.1 hypothetical protein [Pectobacterium quasiaquaticum]MBE5209750.1 hypothetical protein [Pectobacterium quasiaquaticum]
MLSNFNTEQKMLIERLSLIDDLEAWAACTKHLDKELKKIIYESARCLWIKRKIHDGSLLLHPNVRNELIERKYSPLSIHKKMIWASVLVSYRGGDSKEYFKRIKGKIVKKYGLKWWRDVDNRIKPAYAAQQRILKRVGTIGTGVKYFASQSSFIGGILNDELDAALRMIPEE